MTVAVNSSGSQVLVVNTEATLATITTAGYYCLVLDTSVLVNGDTLEVRVYSKTASGATERLEDSFSFQHAQGRPFKRTITYMSPISIRFTLKQVAGTARTVPYAIWNA